jgi:hypothetical protein
MCKDREPSHWRRLSNSCLLRPSNSIRNVVTRSKRRRNRKLNLEPLATIVDVKLCMLCLWETSAGICICRNATFCLRSKHESRTSSTQAW